MFVRREVLEKTRRAEKAWKFESGEEGKMAGGENQITRKETTKGRKNEEKRKDVDCRRKLEQCVKRESSRAEENAIEEGK